MTNQELRKRKFDRIVGPPFYEKITKWMTRQEKKVNDFMENYSTISWTIFVVCYLICSIILYQQDLMSPESVTLNILGSFVFGIVFLLILLFAILIPWFLFKSIFKRIIPGFIKDINKMK